MRGVPGATTRVLRFKSLEEKARWLDAAASIDSTLRYVRELTRTMFNRWLGEPEAFATMLQQYVRDHVAYVHDYRESVGEPGEEFADAETILKRGYDDCDGKSRAFVAMVRASGVPGLEARIRPVFKEHPHRFVHVQTELRYPGSDRYPEAEPGGWLLAEMILQGVGIGEDPMKARKPDGTYQLANDRSKALIT